MKLIETAPSLAEALELEPSMQANIHNNVISCLEGGKNIQQTIAYLQKHFDYGQKELTLAVYVYGIHVGRTIEYNNYMNANNHPAAEIKDATV